MYDLSVIIAARNEEFLRHTIKSVLKASRANTEAIVVLDGYKPDLDINDKRVRFIHNPTAIGQRAAVNQGVRESTAKYIMKLDAHCKLDEGFDVKLMSNIQHDWTVVPRMYNLHVFSWKCDVCGNLTYMGPYPTRCKREGCINTDKFSKVLVWEPRWRHKSDFMRFDRDLHFQYWHGYKKRLKDKKSDVLDLMSCIGAGWLLERDRYWELDGLDEKHGSWGQMGTELACKSWLSGGRMVVNRTTWFSHMFRTRDGFSFPYPNDSAEQARKYSNWLWKGNNWPKAKYKLSWLIEKFWPIKDWDESDLLRLKEGEK